MGMVCMCVCVCVGGGCRYGFSGGETWVMKKAETLDDMLAFWG